MSNHIKTWDERMPKPRVEYQCSMNCSPCSPGRACGDCMPVKVYGDPITARDAEIAELRAELAAGAARQGGDTILKGIPKYEWYLMDRDDTEYYKVTDIEIFVAGTVNDAMRWRFRRQFLESGGAIMFASSGCQLRRAGELVASGETEQQAIDAAIEKEKA